MLKGEKKSRGLYANSLFLVIQGKALTGTLRAMHAESVAALAKIQALPYDPLTVSETAFTADYAAYQAVTLSIERRLATILKQVCFWACTLTAMRHVFLSTHHVPGLASS